MSDLENIIAELRHAHAGDPWHGSSRSSILADVTADEAHKRAGPHAHSIWELVLHMRAWTHEVARRLREGHPANPVEGDYPKPPNEPSDDKWRAAVASLDEAHADLVASVQDVGDAGLDTNVGRATRRFMLHGLAQHDAYHSGQIAILKKIHRGH